MEANKNFDWMDFVVGNASPSPWEQTVHSADDGRVEIVTISPVLYVAAAYNEEDAAAIELLGTVKEEVLGLIKAAREMTDMTTRVDEDTLSDGSVMSGNPKEGALERLQTAVLELEMELEVVRKRTRST